MRVECEGGALLDFQGPWWHQVCRDRDFPNCRCYGLVRVFFQASCSWWSEGLFGLSFSVAPPIQALWGLPSLGVLLCCSACQAHRGAPSGWGPTLQTGASVTERSTLGGVLLHSSVRQAFDGPVSPLFSCQCWHVGRERLLWCLHPLHVTQHYHLASKAAQLSSKGISHHNLLPPLPSICFSAVNSNPRPGIASHYPYSSSQPLHLSEDPHLCPGYVWLWQGCLILIPFRLPQISCFTLSLKCFSPDSDNYPNVGIGPLL